MEYLLILALFVIIFGGLFYITNKIYKRGKRRYWDMYNKVINIQGQVGQIQGQVGQIQGQVGQIQGQVDRVHQQVGEVQEQVVQVRQHLLLEHLADVAARAREMELINSDSYHKSIKILHELEMDNLQGKTIQESEKQ